MEVTSSLPGDVAWASGGWSGWFPAEPQGLSLTASGPVFVSPEQVHRHLDRHEVRYLQFAFRWMNNLLMREVPLPCTIRLWDTYQVSCPCAPRPPAEPGPGPLAVCLHGGRPGQSLSWCSCQLSRSSTGKKDFLSFCL